MNSNVNGTAHKIPNDLKKALEDKSQAIIIWRGLTPLARNEWICWNISVKQEDTRKNHIQRTVSELLKGKRRPCCWIGCVHRKDKKVSPSVQWILDNRSTATKK